VKKLIKEIEWKWRGVRSYFSFKDIRSYKQNSLNINKRSSTKKLVCFDLNSPRIDEDSGRYAYLLIKDFIESGYQVAIAKRFRFFASFDRKPLKKFLSHENYLTYNPKNLPTEAKLILSDSFRTIRYWNKVAQKTKSIFISYKASNRTEDTLFLPYYAHPFIISNQFLGEITPSDKTRTFCISFAGNEDLKTYNKPIIQKEFNIMNRCELLTLVNKYFSKQTLFINNETFNEKFTSSIYVKPKTKLKPENYIHLLNNSRFFLACSGSNFAISHNLVEAMLCGCVPILEYSHHLEKPLTHLVNCLHFKDQASLEQCLKIASEMNKKNWEQIQRNSLIYAKRYFNSGSFSKHLDFNSIHNNTELNMFYFKQPKVN